MAKDLDFPGIYDVLRCKRAISAETALRPAIQKILACLGLPSRAPPIAPAKLDMEDEFS